MIKFFDIIQIIGTILIWFTVTFNREGDSYLKPLSSKWWLAFVLVLIGILLIKFGYKKANQ